MAAQPKKRTSKVRGKTRRAHQHATLPKLVICIKCKSPKLPHNVCPECGHYGKLKVSTTKLDKKIAESLDKPASSSNDSSKKPANNTKSEKPVPKTPKKSDNKNK